VFGKRYGGHDETSMNVDDGKIVGKAWPSVKKLPVHGAPPAF
jgi:hypothetical protein